MQNEIEREDLARMGVAQKCTFCSDRIDFGLENGLTPGIDPRATPACVNSCIADALHFGDIDDREQQRLPAAARAAALPHARGGRHRTRLLLCLRPGERRCRRRRTIRHPARPREPGELRTRGVEPWHQKHWDWKAAGNFICGGAGAGLFAFAALASFWQGSPSPLGWLALAIVALGLFLLLFKIGRPWRFIYVLRQPQRSWMAREAWIAAGFFPLGALALWFDIAGADARRGHRRSAVSLQPGA